MDLKVFITNQDSICDECGEKLGHHAWITLSDNKAFCLSCADLNHLVFLPAGDAALTRRSAKYSTLSAIVLQWSRARKRYERQGLLVEEARNKLEAQINWQFKPDHARIKLKRLYPITVVKNPS